MSDTSLQADLRVAVMAFLDAIDRVDLTALEPFWAEDATMYFPFANTPELIAGREAIQARFAKMFSDLKARGTGPSYIGFGIDSFQVLELDPGHAIVYAMLTFQGQLGRRTILCRTTPGAPRILHLHGSNFAARS